MHARIVAFIPSPSSHECCHTIRTCCISIPMHNESSSNDEICYAVIPCSWRHLGSFPLYSHSRIEGHGHHVCATLKASDAVGLDLCHAILPTSLAWISFSKISFLHSSFPYNLQVLLLLNPPCLIRLLMIIRQWWALWDGGNSWLRLTRLLMEDPTWRSGWKTSISRTKSYYIWKVNARWCSWGCIQIM